ncbi:TetR family transcriptional regulator [Azomonas agilis]|uniref:TetR family transcriptional regulator n=1 Tax=Azomonas agilis TaxID=116849 RepID=A0A562IYD3_9GAMM|nr:TetR/AcrR family transcriptional regulator [Azomonas agilis]TWH75896.1 TetR family transcriptional regulator [Azomonas agilis]
MTYHTSSSLETSTRKPRKNNPDKTREDILQAAITEFVQQGLSGARVDAIAERTRTSKRMIYYYFGSKEQLYLRVLEKLYGDIRQTEAQLNLAALDPIQAICRVVEFTFDHHEQHQDFVRIVSIENIHYGAYVKNSTTIRSLSNSILSALEDILRRGAEQKLFKSGVNPLDVHLLISSFCFYRTSNQYTFGQIFDLDLQDAEVKQRHRKMIIEAVLGYLKL